MAEQYTSIKVVLDKVMRHPLLESLTIEGAIDYTIDFLRIVGVPRMFQEKIAEIEVTNYRGLLPADWVDTVQIRDKETQFYSREATDTFATAAIPSSPIDVTHTVQGGIIYSSMEETTLEISYRAIPTDDDGFPMIPDNSNFTRALTAYIKKEHFTILFDIGKLGISPLTNAKQDYAWAVGACETEFQRLDLSKAEALFNSFRTLIPRTNEFNRGYVNNGVKE